MSGILRVTDLENVFSTFGKVSVSVYSNEFDLAMFKIFFPNNTSSLGYLPNSYCYTNLLTKEIARKHKISVSRNALDDKSFSSVTRNGSLYVHTASDKLLDSDKNGESEGEEDVENKIIECSYINSLFPPGHDGSLQITTIGLYSVTSAMYSKQLCEYIRDTLKIKPSMVFDATACVGGDTLGFSVYLNSSVVCLEKDSVNFSVLQNNIRSYNLENKITAIQGDFNDVGYSLIEKYKPSIVYFDPPWGGKDYILLKKLDLFLGEKNIKDIVNHITKNYSYVQYVIVKVPQNFDTDNISPFDTVRMKKFNVLIFKSWDKSVIKQGVLKSGILKSGGVSLPPTVCTTQISYLRRINKGHLLEVLTKSLWKFLSKDKVEDKFYAISPSENDTTFYSKFRSIVKSFPEEEEKSSSTREMSRLRDVLSLYPGSPDKYLDLGGGDGKISSVIGKHFKLSSKDIVCADIDAWWDEDRTEEEDITYVKLAEGKTLPFDDEEFSLVTCFQSLHHMKNVNLVIDELYRIVKKRGYVVIREHDCEDNYTKVLIDVEHAIFENILKDFSKDFVDHYHGDYKSKVVWSDMFQKSGFSFNGKYTMKYKNNPTKYYYAVYQKM